MNTNELVTIEDSAQIICVNPKILLAQINYEKMKLTEMAGKLYIDKTTLIELVKCRMLQCVQTPKYMRPEVKALFDNDGSDTCQ